MIQRIAHLYLPSLIFLAISIPLSAQVQEDIAVKKAYVKKYAWLAIEEMKRTRIPASIKLAQAMVETNSGSSELANKYNNHFGLKCGKVWIGEVNKRYDDERDKDGFVIESCFRVYPSIKESYMDHSAYLMSPEKSPRYGTLFALEPTNYRAWAEGLQRGGYSTNPEYAASLIRTIELLRLHELDQKVIKEMKLKRP